MNLQTCCPRGCISLAALGLLTLSCHNPKAADKANFKAAIQEALDKRPDCLVVSMPNEPRDFNGHPRDDPQGDALVAVGLAKKQRVMVENSGWSLFGGPKQIPGVRYDLTAEGRKYVGHPPGVFSAADSPTRSLCYGTPEVLEIVRYSEPGTAMGQTVTEVTYLYALKSAAPWTQNAAIRQAFPELTGHIATRDHPAQAVMDLVLMNDGWRAANLAF